MLLVAIAVGLSPTARTVRPRTSPVTASAESAVTFSQVQSRVVTPSPEPSRSWSFMTSVVLGGYRPGATRMR
ncbi:MAG: hypothetical protein JWN08_3838 [Frankiales bacterium]|nr:hypothetical protein [Frankiales bacterium]